MLTLVKKAGTMILLEKIEISVLKFFIFRKSKEIDENQRKTRIRQNLVFGGFYLHFAKMSKWKQVF